MLRSKGVFAIRIGVLRYQSKLFSTQEDEWQNAKPYNQIPGPSMLKLIKETALPGGRYYKLPMIEMMTKFRQDFGSILRLPGSFGRKDIVMLFSPDDIEKVHRNEGKMPIRRGIDSVAYFRKNYRQDIYKDAPGIVTTQGEEWYNFRSKVNGVLMQPKVIKLYVPKIDAVAKDFIKKIRVIRDSKNEMPDDFMENLNDWGFESIGVIALDTRLGVMDNPKNHKLNQMMKKVFISIYEYDAKPSIWRMYKTPGFKAAMKNFEDITEVVNGYVMEAIKKYETNESSGENEGVLEKLLKIDKNIAIVMVQDMLLGGIDTTSTTLTVVLYSLAKHPEKQEILRQEIFKLLPGKDSELTGSSLNNIPYLRACMKEALRLYAPTSGNSRAAQRDLVLSGYQVPRDVRITCFYNCIN